MSETSDDETAEVFTKEVNVLFANTMVCSQKPESSAGLGIVLAQFKPKVDKEAVFKASSNLFEPLLGHELDVDQLCDVLPCMKSVQSMIIHASLQAIWFTCTYICSLV